MAQGIRNSSPPCSVQGCERVSKASGLCLMYYKRWRAHGSTELPAKRQRPECAVEGCERISEKREWCNLHYKRWSKTGQFNLPPERTCEVPKCARRHFGHGMCLMHYKRWRKYGDPMITKRDMSLTMKERFWAKVDKNGPNGCWIWTASRDDYGYGQFRGMAHGNGAHRYSWELVNGPIPEGLVIDHFVCENPPCVNPAHMIVTTNRHNVTRSGSLGMLNARKTHCVRGHPFDASNTSYTKTGTRVCKTCQRERSRERRARERRGAAH